MRMNDLGLQFV